MDETHQSMDSPAGALTVSSNGQSITQLRWGDFGTVGDAVTQHAVDQLTEYIAGHRHSFDVPLFLPTSDFGNRFARALCAIPFGETVTYGDLARDLGVSAQAIGQACGANRIPILIPCHRVLGANSLGGFSGGVGIDTKVWLLKHEGAAGLLI